MIDISYLDLYFNEKFRSEQKRLINDNVKYSKIKRELDRFVRVFLSKFGDYVGKDKILEIVRSNKKITYKELFLEMCNYCEIKCSDDYLLLMSKLGKEYSEGAKLILKEVFGENINKKRSL